MRLYWLLFGNAILLLSAVGIARHGSGLSAVDIVYAAGVFALVLFRYLDVTYFKGQTSDGEPASPADWRRYTFRLVLLSLGGWIAAHAIGFLLHG